MRCDPTSDWDALKHEVQWVWVSLRLVHGDWALSIDASASGRTCRRIVLHCKLARLPSTLFQQHILVTQAERALTSLTCAERTPGVDGLLELRAMTNSERLGRYQRWTLHSSLTRSRCRSRVRCTYSLRDRATFYSENRSADFMEWNLERLKRRDRTDDPGACPISRSSRGLWRPPRSPVISSLYPAASSVPPCTPPFCCCRSDGGRASAWDGRGGR